MVLISRLKSYLKESLVELKKVTWPTKKETIHNSFLVLGICLVMIIFLGITDFILDIGLEKLSLWK